MSAYSLKSRLLHWFHTTDEHAVHSPHFFDFYMKVVKRRRKKAKGDPAIEARRANVLPTPTPPLQLSLFHRRIAHYVGAKTIVECGASCGINTLYLSIEPEVKVLAIEPDPELGRVAAEGLELLGRKNVELIAASPEEGLALALERAQVIDFAVAPTSIAPQFNALATKASAHAIVAIEGIYASEDAHAQWKRMESHAQVYATADLYTCGLLFFSHAIHRQHFVWRF